MIVAQAAGSVRARLSGALDGLHGFLNEPAFRAMKDFIEHLDLVTVSTKFQGVAAALARTGRERFEYGRLETAPDGRITVVLAGAFLEELDHYARTAGLIDSKRDTYLLAYVLHLLLDGRSELRSILRPLLELARSVFPGARSRPDHLLLSRLITGPAEYLYYYSEDNDEGAVIRRLRNLRNRAKRLCRGEGTVVAKQVGNLEVFLEHLQLRDRIRVARGEARLAPEDEHILARLLGSNNAELRVLVEESLCGIKAGEQASLRGQADWNRRLYFAWFALRRAVMLVSGSTWVLIILWILVLAPVWSLDVPPWLIPVTIVAFAAQWGCLVSITTGLDRSLFCSKRYIRSCLLHSLTLADTRKTVAEAEPGVAAAHRDLGIPRFDDPAYDRTFQVDRVTGEVQGEIDPDAVVEWQLSELDDRLGFPTRDLPRVFGDTWGPEDARAWAALGQKWAGRTPLRRAETLAVVDLIRRHDAPRPVSGDPVKRLREYFARTRALDELSNRIGKGDTFGRGQVRVRIWDRDAWMDMSSTNELEACCFTLGTSQIDMLIFLMNGSVSMMDFYSHRGRVLRAFLAACTRGGDRKEPVLLVFDVEGKQRRLIPGVSDTDTENRFIRKEIEDYARQAGFKGVAYNTYVGNARPRSFVEFLRGESRNAGSGLREVTGLALDLTSRREELNLETFGIPVALAWRQLKIAFGLLTTEAMRGRLHKAYWADPGALPISE